MIDVNAASDERQGISRDDGALSSDAGQLECDKTSFRGAKGDNEGPRKDFRGAKGDDQGDHDLFGCGWRPESNDEEPGEVAAAPLDVLPDSVARLAAEIGDAVGCDAGFALGPILAVVGGLIGGTVRLQIGPRWVASAGILQASVGWAGDGRGRAQAYVTDPAMAIDIERAYALDQEENRDARFEAERRMSKADKARQRERAERRRKAGDFDIKSFLGRQVFVQNGTLSDWLHLLARDSHMRGIAVVSHDLARQGLGVPGYGNGVASGFGQASDRQSLMRVWDEAPIDSGRGGDGRHDWMCRRVRPTISVTGTVTPPMLQGMWNDRRDDGFWERWLFVSPDVRPKPSPGDCAEVPAQTLSDWTEILSVLWERARLVAEQHCDARELLRCDKDGRAVFEEGLRRHIEQMNHEAFPHRLRAPWTRLGTYAGRFWLVLTVLHDVVGGGGWGVEGGGWSVGGGAWRVGGGDDKLRMANDRERDDKCRMANDRERDDKCRMANDRERDGEWRMANGGEPAAGSLAAPVASSETARGAWRLVEYFKTHTRRVLSARPSERAAVPADTAAELVLRWIRRHPEQRVVHFRDLTRRYSTAHGYDRQTLLDGVRLLVRRRVLRAIVEEPRGERGAGRPKSKAWAVDKQAERGLVEPDWTMVDGGEAE